MGIEGRLFPGLFWFFVRFLDYWDGFVAAKGAGYRGYLARAECAFFVFICFPGLAWSVFCARRRSSPRAWASERGVGARLAKSVCTAMGSGGCLGRPQWGNSGVILLYLLCPCDLPGSCFAGGFDVCLVARVGWQGGWCVIWMHVAPVVLVWAWMSWLVDGHGQAGRHV